MRFGKTTAIFLLAAIALGIGAAVYALRAGKLLDRPLAAPPPALGLPSGSTDAPISLVFLGTSLSDGAQWPLLAAEMIAECSARPAIPIVIAKGGATSNWGLMQIDAVIEARPDVVFLEFMINDADLRRGVSIEESLENHAAMLDRILSEQRAATVVLLRLNRAHGARAILRPRLPAYERQLVSLAVADRVELGDLRENWQAELGRLGRSAAIPDGVHPVDSVAAAVNAPGVAALFVGPAGSPRCR